MSRYHLQHMGPRRKLRAQVRTRKPRAHLIHIGKTGGTAIKSALAPRTTEGRYQIMLHSHEVGLRQIPSGDKVFFAVRDPLERFVSGFNSRQRQGQPRYNFPWTAGEERAFRLFSTPELLGSALSSNEGETRAAARQAMISIGHIQDSYWRWFEGLDYLQSRRDDLLLIMWFPSLDSSFARLCELLELPGLALPNDDVTAHRNPASADRSLSDHAIDNLKGWYGSDFAFMELCATFDCFARD